jgi:cephalosporin hydroxylase
MEPIEEYTAARDKQVLENLTNRDLHIDTYRFTESLVKTNFIKNFTWMGVPILQYPTDLMIMQEIIWRVKPHYIIETGVAFGGMLMFYRTVSDAIVVGIDIDIRPHAHKALRDYLYEESDLNTEERIRLIEGSSVDVGTLKQIEYIKNHHPVLVSLDSNHTHEHVLQELRLYSPLVSVGSYIVVFDTAIEFFGHLDKNQDRPWKPGNSPYTAVQEFLKENDNFVVDKEIEQRAIVTSAPGGWLRRIK